MMRWSLAALFVLLATPLFAQVPPDKALATMKVADGLQLELFAAEPMLLNPTSIDVDHLGRVWVCEAVNYRRLPPYNRPILRPEGDRIVILTDKDGDGKADESTVFYQGKEIYGPLGVAVAPVAASPPRDASPPRERGEGAAKAPPAHAGGSPGACRVYVCQSPDILLFEDLDGDGKADGPPKKFLSNFGGFDHDHGVHGINIGPDGKLYFTVGDAGVKGLQSSDGKGRKWVSNATDCRAGTVWRCDMDGKNLELIAHNFRNNYECCVNSFGEIWLSDNDDDGNQQTRICHVMPGGDYGYHPRGKGESHWHEEKPGIVHKTLRTGFGSPTGICFYEGTLLPAKYRGQLLHCDAGPREVRCFHVKPKGAGYELEKEVLVTSTDNWFRPSDVCVAPDGSIFIADWYDRGVGGHGMGDPNDGRIYRLTPKGHKGYAVPKVDLNEDRGLIEALISPNLATRSMAIQKIQSIKGLDGINLVQGIGLYRAGPKDAFSKQHRAMMIARAFWLTKDQSVPFILQQHESFAKNSDEDFELIVRLVADVTPDFAALSGPVLDSLEKVGSSARSAVQRELLLAVRNTKPEIAKRIIYSVAKKYDGHDHFYRAALNIACGTDPARRDAILADFDKHFPEWNDKVADLVWELRPKSVLPRLQTLLADAKLTAAQKGRVVDILAGNDDPAAGKALLALVSADAPAELKARAIENLRLFLPTKWKDLKKGDEVRGAISGLLKSKDQQLAGLQLAAAAPDCTQMSEIEAIATDAKATRDVRAAAVRVIGKAEHVKYARKLIAMTQDPVIGPAAVTALADYLTGTGVNSGAKEAMEALQKLVVTDGTSAELRQAALNALSGTRPGTSWLVRLKEQNQMPAGLVADAGRLLRGSAFPDLRNRANLAFPAPGKLDPKKLPAVGVLAKRTGSADRGRRLLAASLTGDAQCQKCHTVRGTGGQVGPDLSMIGKKASRENLFESILQPNKAIADQYIQYVVETKRGQQVAGLMVQNAANAVTLRDANGKDHTIARADIESLTKSPVSIMPENVVAALTEDELIDLVEYLLTLKTPTLTPDEWQVAGPFPGGNQNAGLDVEHGPGKGAFDPAATFTTKLGKSGWRTIRRGGDGYFDLAAFHGTAANDSVSYLYCEVESPADQAAEVLLGHDDGANLYVNGELRHTEKVTRAAAPEQSRTAVRLRKGKNTLLLKIANGNTPHGFYLTLVSEQELKAGK